VQKTTMTRRWAISSTCSTTAISRTCTVRGRNRKPPLASRAFVGHEFAWELELRVRRDNAPPARLEDKQKLGWSTWLGTASGTGRPDDYTVGLQFEPERYLAAAKSAKSAKSARAAVQPSTRPRAHTDAS
jgi:hypothetical protein